MIIPLLQVIFKPIFGAFEREEFKKFLRLGSILSLIIGSYWTLRVLKDSIFIQLVDKNHIPFAKTASLIFLFPLVMFYTKLLDSYSREKMFYVLSTVYGLATIGFAVLMLMGVQAPADVIAARTGIAFYGTKVIGYTWYIFVESYGSLLPALFWAFTSDITSPDSAKKGFSLIVALAQLGGIFLPMLSGLPKYFGHGSSSITIFVLGFLVLSVSALVKYFLTSTPAELLQSFHGKNEKEAEKEAEKEQEPGFFEGLKLLVNHNYLLAIFGSIFIFEFIVTVFDFNFKVLAGTHYHGVELDQYLGTYASSVNLVALICLLLGVSNITRVLGVGVALALMPIIFGGALVGFFTFPHLDFLFALMVGSKAINYALNGPALKQLYIPTTHDVRFKAQAWIETFGSRGSKEAGSLLNMLAKMPFYKMMSGVLGFAFVGIWFFLAIYLGKNHKRAVENKTVIC